MVIGGCAYLMMLVSNWAAVDYSVYTFGDDFNQNEVSMWVQIVLSWVTGLIYLWTLVAERVLGTGE